jgi:hypothetical protein
MMKMLELSVMLIQTSERDYVGRTSAVGAVTSKSGSDCTGTIYAEIQFRFQCDFNGRPS